MKNLIERKTYLEQLAMWREEEMIKVITGVRRCGKSTLFELYIKYLKSEDVTDEQIISVNPEDQDFSELLNYKILHEHVKSRLLWHDTQIRQRQNESLCLCSFCFVQPESMCPIDLGL